MTKILITEDEAALQTILKYNLEKEGFETIAVMDGNWPFRQLKKKSRIWFYWIGCFLIYPALKSVKKFVAITKSDKRPSLC